MQNTKREKKLIVKEMLKKYRQASDRILEEATKYQTAFMSAATTGLN